MAQTLDHPLELCSQPGKGTRFAITAPRTMPPEMTAPVAVQPRIAPDSIGHGGTRVLIIDNDPSVVTAMRSLLEKWSCEIRSAQTLADIDRMIADGSFVPAIVLADFHLDHGEYGTMAVARLRQAFSSRLPAIVITADHAPELADSLTRADCEVLRKPVRPAELRSLMLHMLG